MLKPVRLSKHLTVDQSLFNFLSHHGNYIITGLILNVDTNPEIGYVGVGDKGDDVTFLPMSKFKNDDSFNPWGKKTGRTSMRVGRFIRKLLPEKILERFDIKNHHIEDFVNSWKSWFEPVPYTLKIVEGDEIKKWYDESNYATVEGMQFGTLWKSCMRYKERLRFLNLYSMNPKCKMLVMLINENGRELVRSRALLWEGVGVVKSYTEEVMPDSINIMDRIYSTHDSDVLLFKKWAEENGYIPKWEQNAKSHLFFDVKNQPVKIKCEIELENSSFSYYPYLDTFPYFNYGNKIISNDEYNFNWNYKLIQATGGLEPERTEEEDEYQEDNDW
jgi:hypothetical protein